MGALARCLERQRHEAESRNCVSLADRSQGDVQRSKGRIAGLEDLEAYLRCQLGPDLEAHPDLGHTEMTFQHHIVTLLRGRLFLQEMGGPFLLEANMNIDGTRMRADIVIGSRADLRIAAIEVKPNDRAAGLMDDLKKLRTYVRSRRSGVALGILVFRSLREPDAAVVRAATRDPNVFALQVAG